MGGGTLASGVRFDLDLHDAALGRPILGTGRGRSGRHNSEIRHRQMPQQRGQQQERCISRKLQPEAPLSPIALAPIQILPRQEAKIATTWRTRRGRSYSAVGGNKRSGGTVISRPREITSLLPHSLFADPRRGREGLRARPEGEPARG